MSLAHWARWLAWLAAETTVLVTGAAMLHLWLRSPRAGRTIWRAALTAVALVWIGEMTGLRDRMAGPVLKQHQYVITTELMTPSAVQTPSSEWQRRPAADPRNSGETPLPLWPHWPLWVWLTGSLLLLARFGLARVCLAARRRKAAPADEESLGLIARWRTSFGLRRVESQVWAELRGPVAFGVFRPTVALPPDFSARFSPTEREAMLAHEMAHLAAHDPFWWMVSDAILALAWWHPLVWWARRQLQSAHEAAADEASALIPGGARVLAECLVRLGRELTAFDPARAMGVGGSGHRSQLAARIERLLREPRAWQPLSIWARWTPQVSAILVALASAILPIQTGLSGSILAMLATAAPARADAPQDLPAQVAPTKQAPVSVPAAEITTPAVIAQTAPILASAALQPTEAIQAVPALAPVSPMEATTNVPPKPAHLASVARLASKEEKTNPPTEVLLLVQLVALTEPGSAEIGLDWLFGLTPTNNPAVEISHDWVFGVEPDATNHNKTARRTASATPPENLMIDHLRTDGQSAILKPEQFAALRNRILLGHADLLSAPKAITLSGREACMKIQDITTVVTGVQTALQPASINYSAENVGVGPTVDIVPTQEEDGKWRLRVRASVTAFLGYDNPKASISNPGGKPIGYEIPHPHFRAVEADAEDSLLPGQTLALRGPLWTETTKTRGHFLVPAKTKAVRQRLYIFVTPTPISPTGVKKT